MRNKIGILMENRFIENEIEYYRNKFPEEKFQLNFLTRLWGQPSLTFKSLDLTMELAVDKSFEHLTDEDLKTYAALIVPAGYVADYLLYAEKPLERSPAVQFVEKVMADTEIVKGFICHSLWIAAPAKATFTNRHVTCHNNIIYHVQNTGMIYKDEDVVVDKDLITARTGDLFSAFTDAIINAVR